MTPFIRELRIKDPLRAFAALQHLPYSLLLDSADLKHMNGRYSFVMSHPIETIESKDGEITLTNWEEQTTREGDVFDIIAERVKHWVPETETIRGIPPFQGGAAGYFGYDIGRTLETLPDDTEHNPDMPDMAVGIYDQVMAFDHKKNQAWMITHAKNYHEARKKQDYILGLIMAPTDIEPFQEFDIDWQPNFSKSEYIDQLSKTIRYIKNGDIFQANLSQRFDADLPQNFDAFSHYSHMRKINPAPFSAFMNCGDVKVSSSSPERFLTVRGRRVQTRPIKGTRPLTGNKKQDKAHRKDLENSTKDRAENTMIVDLLRNDLSKVCLAQSIEVTGLCETENFASVQHLVSTVRGVLKKRKGPLDLLKACFPGGSITGAPKIRAMEIIEELEPTRRGPYCGSMAYVGFDGNMDSSILIRTLVYDKNQVSLQVGGGIVADSVPEDEYQETLDKAAAIFKSFQREKESSGPEYLRSA